MVACPGSHAQTGPEQASTLQNSPITAQFPRLHEAHAGSTAMRAPLWRPKQPHARRRHQPSQAPLVHAVCALDAAARVAWEAPVWHAEAQGHRGAANHLGSGSASGPRAAGPRPAAAPGGLPRLQRNPSCDAYMAVQGVEWAPCLGRAQPRVARHAHQPGVTSERQAKILSLVRTFQRPPLAPIY